MNVCQFTQKELYDFDMLVKNILCKRGMLGRQASDERLYLKRQDGGRGLKSLRQVYKETKVRVATYMVCSTSRWIRIAWKREYNSEYKSLKREAEQALREVGVEVQFREEEIWKDSEKMEKEWAGCWAELKKGMQNGYTEKLKNDYKKKGMQSQVFAGQENESLVWLNTNITP